MTEIEELLRGAEARQSGFADHARQVRINARLSQRAIAEAVGVHQTTLNAWEHRTALPLGEAAARWAEVVAAVAARYPLLAEPDHSELVEVAS